MKAWVAVGLTILVAGMAQTAAADTGGSIRLDAMDGTGVNASDRGENTFSLNQFYYSASGSVHGSSYYGRLSAFTLLHFSPGYLRGQQQILRGEANAGSSIGDYGTLVSDTLPYGTPIRVVASIKLGGSVLATNAEWVTSNARAEARLVTYSTQTGIQYCSVNAWNGGSSSERGKPIVVDTFVGNGMSLQYSLNAVSAHQVAPELRYSSDSRANVYATVMVSPPAGVRFEAASGFVYPRNQILFR